MRIQTLTNGSLNSDSGFTLAETLVAILTGAIMLAALYASFAFGYSAVKLTQEDLRATQILLQRMEILRLTSFSEIQTGTFTDYYDPSAVSGGNAGASGFLIMTKSNSRSSLCPKASGILNLILCLVAFG